MTPASEAESLDAPLAGLRILVVEDEPFIAFDLMMAIEDAGAIPVGPAATIADALDIIRHEPPEAAIVDVNLPDGTIGAVLDALPTGTGVVVHTGVGLPDEIRAVHVAVPVFTKPTAPAILLAQIASSIRR